MRLVFLLTVAIGLPVTGAPIAIRAETATRLKIAVVQMALAPTLAENRDRIVSRIPQAAALGAASAP